jgi:uncharacterized protein YecE (DUF72 family)
MLVTESDFYPPHVRTPPDRLRFYASRFPLVEVDSTFYRVPSEQMSGAWDARTPADFVFNIKAFRSFTLHPCPPGMLPADLRAHVLAQGAAPDRNLYWPDLPAEVQTELWRRFWQALQPLYRADKLGAVVLQFPPWFFPSEDSRQHILTAQRSLPGYRLAIEFRDVSWVSSRNLKRTMDFLAEHELTYICVDQPQTRRAVPPIVRVTAPRLAMVRFHGRNAEAWNRRADSAAERHRYLYSEAELEEWLPRIKQLAERAAETHAVFANSYRDYAVRNAAQLMRMLAQRAMVGRAQSAGHRRA